MSPPERQEKGRDPHGTAASSTYRKQLTARPDGSGGRCGKADEFGFSR